MANITVTLPDSKLEFFKNLIKNLGFKYSEEDTNYAIPDWQQNEVHERLEDYKKNPDKASSFDDSIKSIEKKHGI